LPAISPNHKFSHDYWHDKGQRNDDIRQNKGGTTTCFYDIGEAADIGQADCRTKAGKNKFKS